LLLTAASPRHFISNAVVYATCDYTHTANQTLEMLQDMFDDRLVSKTTEN